MERLTGFDKLLASPESIPISAEVELQCVETKTVKVKRKKNTKGGKPSSIECNFCPKVFPNRKQLLKHANYVHAVGDR